MSTVHDKSYKKDTDGPTAITKLVFTGTSPLGGAKDKVAFHWRIYAVIGTRSVLFDMTLGGDAITGVLAVSSKDAIGSRSKNILEYAVVPKTGTTVQAIFDLLLKEKMDKYKFTDQGTGCRYWCTVALEKFEKAGLVAVGTKQKWLDWLVEQAKKKPSNIPMPAPQGTFYG